MHVKKRLSTENGPMDLEISLEARPGVFLTIFGPSGAGKSTILRMLSGLTEPDEGKILVNDTVWYDRSGGKPPKTNLPARKRGVGFVFQDYGLFPTMSIRKNLMFALGKKAGAGEIAYVEELLHVTGLTSIAEQMPDMISGGQKQRVALARSLVRKPELLLLDEPLSALDSSMRRKLQDLILELHRKSESATILVSHDISEVFRTSDQVLMMDHGRVVRRGTPAELFVDQQISGKFRFTGEVLAIEREEVVYIVTVLIENSVVRLIAIPEEVRDLQVGDSVVVASKAMNPVLVKMR